MISGFSLEHDELLLDSQGESCYRDDDIDVVVGCVNSTIIQ